ncbi:MAG: hypothetical protein JST22_08230 [Bacteroidetes bacterium]|nr:hypothetical protein [Bacteroidota bacterium]
MKQTVSEQALALVEKKVSVARGNLTPQDAATATGVSVDEARDALSRLMELYITRVTADAEGNILFAFEYPLRRRGTKTAAEKWAEVKQSLWRGFKIFFKVWIGLMVIVYFAIMLILLIALMVAQRSSSGNDRDSRSDFGGGAVAGLLRVMSEGIQYAFWSRAYAGAMYDIDARGNRYRRVNTPRGIDARKKSFIIAIYDLALGPERPAADPLENEREIAAFLRAEKGVITPAEITALSGCAVADSEERLADYLVRFKGDPDITEEGVVVGQFEGFVSGTAANIDAPIVPYWNEVEPPYEHSGNSSGRNAAIIAMILFTLAVGAGMLAGGLETLRLYSRFFHTGAARFLIGYFPIAFSVLFLVTSLLRLPGARRREAERLARVREKKVMRVIFQQRLWRATADQIYFALVSIGEKEMKREEIPQVLQQVLPKLQGEIELAEDGDGVYVFDRIKREVEAAEARR